MATDILGAGLNDTFGEQITIPSSGAAKEVYALRFGFGAVNLTCSTSFRMAFPPKIDELWFYDASAAEGSQWINLIGDAGAGNNALINRTTTGATGTVLDSWATADFLYIGTRRRHGGFFWNMTASVNGTNSVLTMAYSKSDNTFASQAITDGTITGSATMAKDGNVTLDAIPSDWEEALLSKILTGAALTGAPPKQTHWVRFDVDTELDSDTEIEELVAFHEDPATGTSSGAPGFFNANEEYDFRIGSEVGGFEIANQAAASATLTVSWLKHQR